MNSVTISTGASSSVSLNTVSLFKSALARKLPVKISSLTGSDTEEEETSLAAGADGILGETDDSVNRINESDNDKGAQKASSKDFRISPRTVTSMNNEHYTMDTYVEQVKTNYISGDASVLMFGATASRQVN